MANPFLQVSGDAQRALEEFSTAFDAAFTAPEAESQWSRTYGLVNSSRAIRTTYPIPISAAGYVERKGDDKMRSLYERSLSMSPVEWVDGVQEKASIIEAPDFIGWAGEPARIAVEARRLGNRIVASMLESNPNLDFYKDKKTGVDASIPLFSGSHPVNVFDSSLGTFDNDHGATGINATMMRAALQRFRTKKAANGKPLGLRLTHMLVPPDLEQDAKDFLESDHMRLALLAGGSNTNELTSNRYKNIVQLEVCDELTSATTFYLIAANGPKPWILQDGGSPEEIRFDKTDALYKQTGLVGVKYILQMAAAAALPHAIERITIS